MIDIEIGTFVESVMKRFRSWSSEIRVDIRETRRISYMIAAGSLTYSVSIRSSPGNGGMASTGSSSM